jgi:hypothetical protein
VEGKNWGAYESFRLAVKSHVLQRLGGSDRASMESQTVWRAALKAAQSHSEHLPAIAKLAEGWGYHSHAEEAWWVIANNNDNPKNALEALQRLYKAKRDSRGLLRVAKRAFELNPRDLVAANNCASLGLLLSADGASRRLAARLHTEHPENSVFAATFAFGLHTEGKTGEGLKLLERRAESNLRHPAVAAYYFVMLVADGQMQRAELFLANANRASLLPEEQELFTAAKKKLSESAAAKGVAQS